MFVLPLKSSTLSNIQVLRTKNDTHDRTSQEDVIKVWFNHYLSSSSSSQRTEYVLTLRQSLLNDIYSNNCHKELLVVGLPNEQSSTTSSSSSTKSSIVQRLKEYYSILIYLKEQQQQKEEKSTATIKLDATTTTDCFSWGRNLLFDSANNSTKNTRRDRDISFEEFISYETFCILWNLASLDSYQGCNHCCSFSKEESSINKTKLIQNLTKANQCYCLSSTFLEYLFKQIQEFNYTSSINEDQDLTQTTLDCLRNLMLAQGQTCAYQITFKRTPNMHTVLCKLSYSSYELYNKIQQSLLSSNDEPNEELINYITCQLNAWNGVYEYHKGMECALQKKQYGNAICRLTRSKQTLQTAIECSSSSSTSTAGTWVNDDQHNWILLETQICNELQKQKHDNESIYKQPVPTYHELTSKEILKGALMAKSLPKCITWCTDIKQLDVLRQSMFDITETGDCSCSKIVSPTDSRKENHNSLRKSNVDQDTRGSCGSNKKDEGGYYKQTEQQNQRITMATPTTASEYEFQTTSSPSTAYSSLKQKHPQQQQQKEQTPTYEEDPSRLKKPTPSSSSLSSSASPENSRINMKDATTRTRRRHRQQQRRSSSIQEQQQEVISSSYPQQHSSSFHSNSYNNDSSSSSKSFRDESYHNNDNNGGEKIIVGRQRENRQRRSSTTNKTSKHPSSLSRRRRSSISRLSKEDEQEIQSQEQDDHSQYDKEEQKKQSPTDDDNKKKISASIEASSNYADHETSVRDGMKLYSQNLLQVFDQCEDVASSTKVDWSTIKQWIDRHSMIKMNKRFEHFQYNQNTYIKNGNNAVDDAEKEENDETSNDFTTTGTTSSQRRNLLPFTIIKQIQTIQQNETLDQMLMRLWQLRDTSDEAKTLAQDINSTLEETIKLNEEFTSSKYITNDKQLSSSSPTKLEEEQQRLTLLKEEYQHYETLIQNAQNQGDTTLFQLLDDIHKDSKYKLLRMSIHDIEQLIVPSTGRGSNNDRERLLQQLKEQEDYKKKQQQLKPLKGNRQNHNDDNDPLIKAALAMDVSESSSENVNALLSFSKNRRSSNSQVSFRSKYNQLYDICSKQDNLLDELKVLGQDDYLCNLQKRLHDRSSTSNNAETEVRQMIHDECEALSKLQNSLMEHFDMLPILFKQVQREYRIFSKAEQALQIKVKKLQEEGALNDDKVSPSFSSERTASSAAKGSSSSGSIGRNKYAASSFSSSTTDSSTNDPIMIRYYNIVNSIKDALKLINERIEQINDGEQFYNSLIPRLQTLKHNMEDLSTSLLVLKFEYEETLAQKSSELQQLQKDHEAAAELARQLEEEERRQTLQDEQYATELARGQSSGDGRDMNHSAGPSSTPPAAGIVTPGVANGIIQEEEVEEPHHFIHNNSRERDLGHLGGIPTDIVPRPPAMVVHAPSELTACSTLGDPLMNSQHNNNNTNNNYHHTPAAANADNGFFHEHPQYGDDGQLLASSSQRPRYIEHNDRLISDVTLPADLLRTTSSSSFSPRHDYHTHPSQQQHHHQHQLSSTSVVSEEDDRRMAEAIAAAEEAELAAAARQHSPSSSSQQQQHQQRVSFAAAGTNNSSNSAHMNSPQGAGPTSTSTDGSPNTSNNRRRTSIPGVNNVSNQDSSNSQQRLDSATSTVVVDDGKVAELVCMGFDATLAHRALERHENNLDHALNELLS